MRFLRYLLISILIFMSCELIFLTGLWNDLNSKVHNLFFARRGQIALSDQIVIVDIDDDSFSTLDISWPFPRAYHAKLIENLNIAGAKLIIFDVAFTESAPDDSAFASVLKKYDNVVFTGKLIENRDNHYVRRQLLKPIDELQTSAWGLVNIHLDDDGFVRQYTLYQDYDGIRYSSLVMAAYAKLFGIRHNEMVDIRKNYYTTRTIIPMSSPKHAYLNYFGRANTFNYYSYANVIDDSLFTVPGFDIDSFAEYQANGAFRDKIVFVGSSVEELHDIFQTPMGRMPGVEIQATFLEQALHNKFLKQTNYYLIIFIEFLLIFVLVWITYRFKPLCSTIVVLSLIPVVAWDSYLIFTKLDYIWPALNIPFLVLIIYITSILKHYIRSSKERKFIKDTFQQYMAADLVDSLLKNPGQVTYGGTHQELTVLFSDIRAFTTYTEKHEPAATVSILRHYLTAMVEIILNRKGILDKFVGDEIMALFNAPLPMKNHAMQACIVALEMRQKMTLLRAEWIENGIEPFEIGIGINTGDATVGNLGSEQIFDYTAIGDTINIGARLEAINKEYPTKNKIIISEFTLAAAGEGLNVRYLDDVFVKGKNKSLKIYELVSIDEKYLL